MNISGNFTNHATFTHNSGTVNFNGGSAQTIGGSSASTFNNFTANGTGAKIISMDETIAGVLTLTNGVVYINASTIQFKLTSTATVTGANDNSYVDGPVTKSGTSAFVFPVGKIGTGYQAIEISAPSTSTDFTAEYIRENPTNDLGTGHASGINYISQCEYWNLFRTNGTANVDVTIYGNSHSGCGDNLSANYFNGNGSTTSTLVVLHWNSTTSQWENAATTGTTQPGASYPNIMIKAGTVSNFSPFTFGSIANNPLPVKLVSFTAQKSAQSVVLNWVTATEKNNDHFEIERSNDGKNFNKIGEVNGNGTTVNLSNYSFIDENENGNNIPVVYYRLRQVDYNNAFEYSNIASVVFKSQSAVTSISQYPNPCKENINVNYVIPAQGNVTINIADEMGRVIRSTEVSNVKGFNTTSVSVADLPEGIYLLNISFEGASSVYQKIVKQ